MISSKETPEFFDKIKAGELTPDLLQHKTKTGLTTEVGLTLGKFTQANREREKSQQVVVSSTNTGIFSETACGTVVTRANPHLSQGQGEEGECCSAIRRYCPDCPNQEPRKGGFGRGLFCENIRLSWLWRSECQMYCWVHILGYLLFSWVWHWILQTPSLLKPPFLGSWPKDNSTSSQGWGPFGSDLRRAPSGSRGKNAKSKSGRQTLWPWDPTCLVFWNFHLNQQEKEEIVFWGEGCKSHEKTLALDQPRLELVQVCVPLEQETFSAIAPRQTACSFSYRPTRKSRPSGSQLWHTSPALMASHARKWWSDFDTHPHPADLAPALCTPMRSHGRGSLRGLGGVVAKNHAIKFAKWRSSCHGTMGERQSIAQKGVRAIDARKSQLENGSNAAKTSVRAPGLSADEREHPFVWYFGAGWSYKTKSWQWWWTCGLQHDMPRHTSLNVPFSAVLHTCLRRSSLPRFTCSWDLSALTFASWTSEVRPSSLGAHPASTPSPTIAPQLRDSFLPPLVLTHRGRRAGKNQYRW